MSDKKKGFGRHLRSFGETILGLFRIGGRKEPMNALEEEAITTPVMTIVKNYFHNTIGIIGLIGFITIFLVVLIGSSLTKYNPYYNQAVLKNIGPGFGYLKYPSAMQDKKVRDIRSGITFSGAITEDGELFFWGKDYDKATVVPDDIQEKLKHEKVTHLAIGDRHSIIYTDQGNFYGWGNNFFNQTQLPAELYHSLRSEGVKKLKAGVQYSAILTEKGNLYVWGSTLGNNLDRVPKDLQGNVVDFDCSALNIVAVKKDGGLKIFGVKGSEIHSIPKELTDGSVKVKQVVLGTYTAAALGENGKVYVWGSSKEGTKKIPEFDAPVKEIQAGMDYFTALTESGKVYAWGKDNYGEIKNVPDGKYTRIFSGSFQNYAETEDGKVDAWGNNGFILGTDEVGRDLWVRLLHGGKVTLLIAAASVLIQVVIGVIVGMISGFYGGIVDNLLMRFTEIVASFPFYPLVITLSVVLPPDTSQNKRLFLIMMILGVLGWTGIARLVRGQILSEREKDYIMAARALGLREKKIIGNHILPNVLSIVIVQATLGYAGNLLTEAGLSFLGFGVKPPYPSWGNMMTNAQTTEVIQIYWWRWIFPALAVFLAAFTINLIGDALRDAMDPKAAER